MRMDMRIMRTCMRIGMLMDLRIGMCIDVCVMLMDMRIRRKDAEEW